MSGIKVHIHISKLICRYSSSFSKIKLRSQLFIPTLFEKSQEAILPSHQLLLRAGYIRKSSHGMFSLLPLSTRVLEKIETIIKYEMENIGCSKVSLPLLTNAALWRKSGRWNTNEEELFLVNDRRDDEFCLSPTYEELITDLVSHESISLRQLPIKLYQIGAKYRDEIRPRYGLLRTREFIMKDAYTFDKTVEDAMETYNTMVAAYHRIMRHFNVKYVKVDADTGNIGGTRSHEFQVLSEFGEDIILQCKNCGYASNQEKAEGILVDSLDENSVQVDEDIEWTVQKLIDHSLKDKLPFNCDVFISSDKQRDSNVTPIVALTLKGRSINILKLQNAFNISPLQALMKHEKDELLKQDRVINWKVCVDQALVEINAHKSVLDHLRRNKCSIINDSITVIESGDKCSQCQGCLEKCHGIEVGHVFYLGTKYSQIFNASFIDSEQKKKDLVMGCYGIGVTRLFAAIIESNYDNRGIMWPESISPYKLLIVTAGSKKESSLLANLAKTIAEEIEVKIPKFQGDTVLDDRWNETIGKKLTEAELVGYTWTIIIGKLSLSEEIVEVKNRCTKVSERVPIKQLIHYFK